MTMIEPVGPDPVANFSHLFTILPKRNTLQIYTIINKEFVMSADLVLTNGRIHTMNLAHPTATALAIRDGKFLCSGG